MKKLFNRIFLTFMMILYLILIPIVNTIKEVYWAWHYTKIFYRIKRDYKDGFRIFIDSIKKGEL